MKLELSGAIPLRLPKSCIELLKKESQETGIPVSMLMRRSILRDYPLDSFVGGDSTISQEDTTSAQAHDSTSRESKRN